MTAFSFLARAAQYVGLFHPQPTLTLEELLDAAKPAEERWFPADYDYIGAELGWVCRMTGPADGLWLCHFGHENRLTHFKGKYPFKYLKCARCDHVMCEKCPTTEILTRIYGLPDYSRTVGVKGDEVRYCSVCTCGLSRRATVRSHRIVFSAEPCPCRRLSTKKDDKYFIGSVETWRLDPAGRGVALRLERRQVGTWETLSEKSCVVEDSAPNVVKTVRAVGSVTPAHQYRYLDERSAYMRPPYKGPTRHNTYWHPVTARPVMGPRALTIANP